jgi:putative phosphoesterase
VRLAIISDTHVPARADAIPGWVADEVRRADHVVHAGDVQDAATLDRVRGLASGLTAVRGNVDPDLGLPSTATVAAGGVTVVVTHGTGDRAGYERRVARTVKEHAGDGADGPAPANAVGVAGHTHEPLDTVHDGVRILNPGSATGANPAERTTMLTAEASGGDLDVTLREA